MSARISQDAKSESSKPTQMHTLPDNTQETHTSSQPLALFSENYAGTNPTEIPTSQGSTRNMREFSGSPSGPTARPPLSYWRVSLYLSHLCFQVSQGIALYPPKFTLSQPRRGGGKGYCSSSSCAHVKCQTLGSFVEFQEQSLGISCTFWATSRYFLQCFGQL